MGNPQPGRRIRASRAWDAIALVGRWVIDEATFAALEAAVAGTPARTPTPDRALG